MSTITSNAGALDVLSNSFRRFDTAHELTQPDAAYLPDGLVSADDLRAVAYDTTGTYTPQEQEAAKYLLDHPELWRMLDTANSDGPTDDGLVSQNDVDAAMDSPLLENPDAVPYANSADPYGESMETLKTDFATFDRAGDGGKDDGQVSMNDLIAVGYGQQGDYSPEQRAAARYLLDHTELFHAMDTDGDGLIRIGDVETQAAAPVPANANQVQPASLDTNGDGQLSDAEIQAGAENNAPILYLDPDDGFLLTDPEAYIEGSRVIDEDGNVVDDPVAYLNDPKNAGKQLIVDPGDKTKTNREPDATKTYYEYNPENNSITYYYFYPNNDGPAGGVGDVQNHEGDWEKVTVYLDDEYRPNSISYSAHGGDNQIPWSQVIKEDGRPVVFVAQGSHANYFVPGDDYHTVGSIADDETVDSPADGVRWDSGETELVRVDKNNPLWWQYDNVYWGERGLIKDTSGPKSPFNIAPPAE